MIFKGLYIVFSSPFGSPKYSVVIDQTFNMNPNGTTRACDTSLISLCIANECTSSEWDLFQLCAVHTEALKIHEIRVLMFFFLTLSEISFIRTWGTSLFFFFFLGSCQYKLITLFWLGTAHLSCSAARRDQQEIMDHDTTTALGNGAMETTANDDWNASVKAQPWNSLFALSIQFLPLKT